MEQKELFEKGAALAQEGEQHLKSQQFNQSIEKTLEAIDCFVKSDNQIFVGKAFRQLAEAYKYQQNWVGCLAGYQESINWDLKVGKLNGVLISQLHVFRLLLQLGQYEKALQSLEDAKKNLRDYPEIPKADEFRQYIAGLEKDLKERGIVK